MPEDEYPEPQAVDVRGFLSTIIGLIFVIGGTIVACWVFWNVYTMFTNPQALEVFTQIVPDKPELREFDLDGKKVTMPEGIFHFMAYSVGTFLLFIAGIIAGRFISAGAGLLQPALQKWATKIDRKMEDLKKKMDRVGESLEKKG